MFHRKRRSKTASSGIKEKKHLKNEANNPAAVLKLKIQNVRDTTIILRFLSNTTLIILLRSMSYNKGKSHKNERFDDKEELFDKGLRQDGSNRTDSIRGPSRM